VFVFHSHPQTKNPARRSKNEAFPIRPGVDVEKGGGTQTSATTRTLSLLGKLKGRAEVWHARREERGWGWMGGKIWGGTARVRKEVGRVLSEGRCREKRCGFGKNWRRGRKTRKKKPSKSSRLREKKGRFGSNKRRQGTTPNSAKGPDRIFLLGDCKSRKVKGDNFIGGLLVSSRRSEYLGRGGKVEWGKKKRAAEERVRSSLESYQKKRGAEGRFPTWALS